LFTLKKLNVFRIVENEFEKAKLLKDGFVEVMEEKVKIKDAVKEETKKVIKKGKND